MEVLIIEDEQAACLNMRRLLSQIDPTITILDSLDSVTESVNWFRNHQAPDLVFMDIQLADGTSFHLFECIDIEAPIIFTTAYDAYAIEAFKVNSIDYILKPITLANLREALAKFERIKRLSLLRSSTRDIAQILQPKAYLERILVPQKDLIIPVKVTDIAFLYSTAGKVTLVTLANLHYVLEKSLDSTMDKLDPQLFFRANRQFILAKDAIESITVWFDNRLLIRLLLPTAEPIYIAKNKALEFKRWFSGDS